MPRPSHTSRFINRTILGEEYKSLSPSLCSFLHSPVTTSLLGPNFLDIYTGLFKMIVGIWTTCHTQYPSDSSIFLFLFNRTTLQVYVTYLTGALYVHPLWFYKHQHDNRVRSRLFVACQWLWFQWRFWFVPSLSGYLREEDGHKPNPWRNPFERNHMGLHVECTVYDADNHSE